MDTKSNIVFESNLMLQYLALHVYSFLISLTDNHLIIKHNKLLTMDHITFLEKFYTSEGNDFYS